ncbi:hypothetical protein [Leptothermofonsia sp. ETS-13]|uniref:hypothetical protein n=1 Tax=Leptothermofonsia sp. ETS-13 TaxID=3035696 RepID=UPI003BA0C8FC
MKPEIYAVREGYRSVLAKAPIGDPELEYRKEVERRAQERNGQLSNLVLMGWEEKRKQLNLSPEEADIIRVEVLKPYQEFEEKLNRYQQALMEAFRHEPKLTKQIQNDLKYFQHV